MPNESLPAVGRHLVIHPVMAVALMCGGEAVLTVSDALTKSVIGPLSSVQIVGVRGIFLVSIVLAFCGGQRSFTPIVTTRPFFHVVRALSGVGGAVTYFLSLNALPLGIAVALSLLSPICSLVLAVVFFGERLNAIQVIAVFGGLLGAFLLAFQPSVGLVSYFGVGMGLLSGVLSAVTWLMVPVIGRKDHSLTFIFFLNVMSALFGLCIERSNLVNLTTIQFGSVALIAILTMAGQLLVVRAYLCGQVSLVAPFKYSDLLWALMIGYVVWGEAPTTRAMVGASLLVLSGAVLLSKRRLQLPRSPVV